MSYIIKFNLDPVILDNRVRNYLSEATTINTTTGSNYASNLPEVYSGSPNRIARYSSYESMDLDSHISAALDVIAEFCTQVDPESKIPFTIEYNEEPTETNSDVLMKMLKIWVNINDFGSQLFDIFRDVLKYGDQFYIRDPETYQWLRIYHGNVEKVIVNESKGKIPEQYVIKDLDLNLQNLSVTQLSQTAQGMLPGIPGNSFTQINQNTRQSSQGGSISRFSKGIGTTTVNAEHVVHINMTKRGNPNWPFGDSILEKVFKTYKQKELLEDSILIYRIQRAPMRRIFYIDVGEMPEHKAMAFMEQVKNSVNQRRIPSKTGTGQNVMDASYNPLSMLDDFYLPQRSDGRGSKIESMPGGDTAWGIQELQYFDNKLARGLKVPSSYLPTGPEDSPVTYNDGKVGAALIQEFRFAESCKRVQRSIVKKFDEEFKLYLKKRDINVDSGMFTLGFVEPQSFVSWRKIELDSARINNFNQVVQQPYFSKRWAMLTYLDLTQDQISKNHEMLMEENPSKFKKIANVDSMISGESPVDLRNIGFSQNDFNQAPGEEGTNPEGGSEENAALGEPGGQPPGIQTTGGAGAPTQNPGPGTNIPPT